MSLLSVHANSVVFNAKGFLICGESGSGKSDLSLRLIDAGAILISDDYTHLTVKTDNTDTKLYAVCPDAIKGLLEVRGIGIIHKPFIDIHKIDYIIELSDTYSRMPEMVYCDDYSVQLRKFVLNPFELSVINKIKLITTL
jgi:serine kinase of HPr protein (carbohydrate metabolism regulator)